MLINELSKRTELTAHTLRYYENLGLIEGRVNPQITSNNYKNYDEETVRKVKMIKDMQGIGFTLAEIKKMLDDYYGGKRTREEQIAVFKDKITEIDNKIECFKQVKSRLSSLVKDLQNGAECAH